MKIKEVEVLVGINRANIRFYEKEGLISPVREKENNYSGNSDTKTTEHKYRSNADLWGNAQERSRYYAIVSVSRIMNIVVVVFSMSGKK